MPAADPAADPAAAPRPGTSVTAACRELVSALAADHELASVHLLLDGRLRCIAAGAGHRVLEGATPEAGVLGHAVRTGRTVVVPGTAADADLVPSVPGARAQVVAPVSVDGRCVGAVSIAARSGLGAGAVAAAEAAADRLGTTIRGFGGVSGAPIGQRLARLAVELGAEGEIERLRRMVVEGVAQIAGFSSAALVGVSPGDRWEVVCSTGPLAQAVSQWRAADLARVAGWVSVGTSAHATAATSGADDALADDGLMARSGVRTLAVHPLATGGSLVGLLVLADTDPHAHDPVAVAAVEVVAALAAAALRAARLLRDQAERAREALTGVADAGEFRADLTDFCITAIQTGEVTRTCMLLDVDGLQAVNDSRGRDGGDELLSALVEALTGQLRHGDSLYRVDGDEFAVLLATGSPQSASAVAGRLVRAAADAGAPVRLGWALVDGPPGAVQEQAAASLREAKVAAGHDRPDQA